MKIFFFFSGNQEKEKVNELEKPIDFMKKIGWISKDEKELKKFKASTESNSTNNQSTSSESSNKKKPNDSSKIN